MFRLGEAGDPDAEAILSTLDFFTPVVESPFDFGRVAAANALSDIYAMGGEPLFALNVVAFPAKELPMEVLGEILRGGAAVAAEAGIPILGGHSTDFDVPVYGMAVTGRVKASRVRRNVGARVGDAILLTKPIGTGILTSALRARALASLLKCPPAVSADEESSAVASMARLNRDASKAANGFDVSAGTDVTGYGLLGHLREMLLGSGVAAELSVARVPLLPGARRLAEQGSAPSGSLRNLETARPELDLEAGVTDTDLLLLADAQTSGGLLLTMSMRDAAEFAKVSRLAGDVGASEIGRIVVGRPGRVRVRP